jgi:hypothetical protein
MHSDFVGCWCLCGTVAFWILLFKLLFIYCRNKFVCIIGVQFYTLSEHILYIIIARILCMTGGKSLDLVAAFAGTWGCGK